MNEDLGFDITWDRTCNYPGEGPTHTVQLEVQSAGMQVMTTIVMSLQEAVELSGLLKKAIKEVEKDALGD